MVVSRTEELRATNVYISNDADHRDWVNISGASYGVTLNDMHCYVEIETPQFGQSTFSFLKTNFNTYSSQDCKIMYALCSSDINRDKYLYYGFDGNIPEDEYQLVIGSCDVSQTIPLSIEISRSDICLSENTKYYLFLWYDSSYGYAGSELYLGTGYGFPAFTIGYKESVVYISSVDKYDEYQCYIDNGTKFEPYIPYIDNGTTWEPLYG